MEVNHSSVSIIKKIGPVEGCSNDIKNDDDDDDSGWDTDLECEDLEHVYDPHQHNRDRYIAACKTCGVIPASYFLRNMNNVRLNMAHHGFGAQGVKALSLALLSNTHLVGLDLCDNSLGNDGVQHLCEMLIENCYITDLDLSENNVNFVGLQYICNALHKSDILKRLSLKGNLLETKSSALLSQTLMRNSGLRYLNLSHNNFGEDSGLHFATLLAQNDVLEELDLSWNSIRQKGACGIANSLKHPFPVERHMSFVTFSRKKIGTSKDVDVKNQENITLKKLDVSWNGFGDDGIYVLSQALVLNNSLEQLNLSSNRITHVGAAHLKEALLKNEGLVVFKLGQNPLQHGSMIILQALISNDNSTITELDLSDIQVSSEFIHVLEKHNEEQPQVRVYHGGLGGSPQKAAERPKPMRVLRDYIKNNQMRVLDFFKSLDKDKSMSISIPEFVTGLKEAGVPLRHDELVSLVESLDLDGDGEIDYKELLIGNQESAKEERQEVLKEKADKERKRHLSKNLKPSTPSSEVRKTPTQRADSPSRNTPRSRSNTARAASAIPREADKIQIDNTTEQRRRSKTINVIPNIQTPSSSPEEIDKQDEEHEEEERPPFLNTS